MKEVIVNHEDTYSVEIEPEGIMLNGQLRTPDIRQVGERRYHCVDGTDSYSVELLEVDPDRKQFVFMLGGQRVQVQLKDEIDLVVEKLGMAQATEAVVREVAAPMPGLIVGLNVEVGQAVQEGDSLLTLEAMKMENVVKSPVSGTVAAVHVQAGDSVEKKQILISFE
jgi:biotin carboxyl carrier protein